MPPKPAGPEYLDEHHQRITEFAGEYFDDDEERESFVDTLMERRGYQRRSAWAPPADPPGGPGGSAGAPKGKTPYFKR